MAQPKLSKHAVKMADSIVASAAAIRNLTDKVDEKRVRELVRRVSIPVQPDGYPSSSMPESTSGGSTSDPTFGAMLAGEKRRKDPVADDLKRLNRDLEEAESRLRAAVARLDGIDKKVEEKVERAVSTPCSVCQQLPASKAGYCPGDYLDWWRHGRPERSLWELYRRKEVNSEGILLVPECPMPSPGNVAAVGPWRAGKNEEK